MAKHLIENASVLDCTGADPKPQTSLFTDGSRIAKIGPAQTCGPGQIARVHTRQLMEQA